jgi:hypothetical protein
MIANASSRSLQPLGFNFYKRTTKAIFSSNLSLGASLRLDSAASHQNEVANEADPARILSQIGNHSEPRYNGEHC